MIHRLPRNVSQRKCRLFLVACCYRILDLMPEGVGRTALSVAESFADKKAGDAARRKAQREATVVPDGPGLETVNALYSVLEATKKTIAIRTADTSSAAAARGHAARRRGKGKDPYVAAFQKELAAHAVLLRDIFGNPFRPVAFDPRWRSESAVSLARTAYDTRDFSLLPILADALEEAGCDHPDVLSHCRDPNGVHVRGCWVVDGVLGKT
jgi:hypothetical protein